MNRRLLRYIAPTLAALALGCEDQPATAPPSSSPTPAVGGPPSAPKQPARGEVAKTGPSTAPLKD